MTLPSQNGRLAVALVLSWLLAVGVVVWGCITTVMWRKADVERYWAMRDTRDAERQVRELRNRIVELEKEVDRGAGDARDARACTAEIVKQVSLARPVKRPNFSRRCYSAAGPAGLREDGCGESARLTYRR